jgi:hexosaminidase
MRIPPLLPAPRVLHPRSGTFRLRPGVPIVLDEGSTEGDYATAVALRDAVASKAGFLLSIETHARREDLGARVELLRSGASGEGYSLDVGQNRVTALGAGPAGLRYAVETLSQLLLPGTKSVPGCTVEDAPELPMRGVLLDVSRGKVPTLATLERFVDFMVAMKLNLLMLYTEHVFRFRRHPLIGREDSPMSASELRELDGYAAARHVELVPTLQSLGHMQHVLKHGRYAGLAESERKWSISPALEESYALLDDLYAEYLGNFRSRWFNANCDEPVDLGKGRSKEWADRDGAGAVFAAHLERVRALAAKHGKKTMAWADVVHEHPDAIPLLPKDLVLIDWWYEANHDFDRVRVFQEHRIPFLTAAGTASWNTLFPRVQNALANIRGHAEAAKRYGALGLVTTDWGDGGHGNLLGNSLYPLAYGAEAAWGRTELDWASFDRAFSLQLFESATGFPGRLYRRLGALHQTGFDHFNNSPIRSLYFDDLSAPKFTHKVRPAVLKRTLAKLARARAEFERGKGAMARRPLERDELGFAIEASIVAARKGLAGARFLAQAAEAKGPRGATGKRNRGLVRGLARELARLAADQVRLKRMHHELWLARDRKSNFEITASYYDGSVRGLRRAVRRLRS